MTDAPPSAGFPVADRPRQTTSAFAARVELLTPGDDVPDRRSELRAVIGSAAVPMVELDAAGTVLFVGGDWESLVGFTKPGPNPLGVLLKGAGDRGVVEAAITQALDERLPSVFEHSGHDELGYLKVQPVPSATRAGTLHVLVGLSGDSDLERRTVAPSVARHAVTEPPPVIAPRITADPQPAVASSPATTAAAAATSTAHIAPTAPAPPTAPAAPVVDPVVETAVESVAMAPEPKGPSFVQQFGDRARTMVSGDAFRGIPPLDWLGGGLVLLVAFFLRARGLEIVPAGMHGDEAITGLEAQRILDQGSIGVYTGSALGQPTLPFYFSAIMVSLFGPSVWAVRIASAIAGTAVIALVWFVVRRRFDQPTAIAAAFAMTTMTWSLHFSRIAFGVAWWPFFAFLAAALLDRATRHRTWQAWAVAGAAAGIGVYVYNSHWFFGVSVAAFLLVWFVRQVVARRPADSIFPVLGAAGGALIVLLPMRNYMADDRNAYFNHFNLVSRRSSPEWTEAGIGGKIAAQIDWYFDSWNVLLFSSVNDGADASGIIPMVPRVFVFLAAVGVITMLLRHRTWFSAIVLLVLFVTPLGASMTTDGLTRRNFSIAPFIAIVAGIGAVTIWRWVRGRAPNLSGWVIGAMALAMVWTGVVPYFTEFRNDPSQKWVFSEELTIVSDAILDAEEDGPVFVNWYSPRHYYDYSTLDFLLDAPGVDRAPVDQGLIPDPSVELQPDINIDQLYVMIGDYALQLEKLQADFPDGRVLLQQEGPRILVYRVPS